MLKATCILYVFTCLPPSPRCTNVQRVPGRSTTHQHLYSTCIISAIFPHAKLVDFCHISPVSRPPGASSRARDRIFWQVGDSVECQPEGGIVWFRGKVIRIVHSKALYDVRLEACAQVKQHEKSRLTSRVILYGTSTVSSK